MVTTQAAPAKATAGIWNPTMETLPRSEIEVLQSERLVHQVRYVYENAPVFRQIYDEAGVKPSDIHGLQDLHKLPIVEKDHLRAFREQHGDVFGGGRCVPTSQLYLVNHSSGTTGRPTVYGLTKRDHDTVSEIFARVLYAMGIRPGYKMTVLSSIHWHGYVIGLESGAQRIGAVPFRIAGGPQDVAPTMFERFPDADFDTIISYQPELEMAYIREHSIRPREYFPNLKFLYSAVDMSDARRRMIERVWERPIHNSGGSGDQYYGGGECEHSAPYYHMPDDYFIFEVLDPFTHEPVPPGGTGELFVTNLWAEGFPYIRYRMEDMVTYQTEQCDCGRTSMRLRILGRLPWSVDVQGKRIFSIEVEDVVWDHPQLEAVNYQLVRQRQQPQDQLEVRLAPDEPIPNQDYIAGEVSEALSARFGVPASVTFLEKGAIGLKGFIKMQRVVDAE